MYQFGFPTSRALKAVVGAAFLYGRPWRRNVTLWKQRLGEEMEHPWAGGSEQPEENRQDLHGSPAAARGVWSLHRMDAGQFCEDLTSKGAKGPRRPFRESGDWLGDKFSEDKGKRIFHKFIPIIFVSASGTLTGV